MSHAYDLLELSEVLNIYDSSDELKASDIQDSFYFRLKLPICWCRRNDVAQYITQASLIHTLNTYTAVNINLLTYVSTSTSKSLYSVSIWQMVTSFMSKTE